MSEERLPWWFRLYPKEFRDLYGREMLLLIRDRRNDEPGRMARALFWLDLVRDTVSSLPRVYLHDRSSMAAASSSDPQGLSFRLVDQASPRSVAFLLSTVLSVSLFHFLHALHPCPDRTISESSALSTRLIEHVVVFLFP